MTDIHWHITVVGDYGGGYQASDLAFIEVTDRLHTAFPGATINCVSTPAFDTLTTGFCVAQLALNASSGNGKIENRLIYHNTAPRADDTNARQTNKGEGLAYCRLDNGVHVIGVNAGHTFSLLKPYCKEIYHVNIGDTKSQFRSRDTFPPIAGQILVQGDESPIEENIRDLIPDFPEIETGSFHSDVHGDGKYAKVPIVYIDGYGNIKLGVREKTFQKIFGNEDVVNIRIADHVERDGIVVFEKGMFGVRRDDSHQPVVLSHGSSGWEEDNMYMQASVRYGNAAQRFGQNCYLQGDKYVRITQVLNPENIEKTKARMKGGE